MSKTVYATLKNGVRIGAVQDGGRILVHIAWLPMTLPRYAVLYQNGRRYRVRVLDYRRGLFRVLDTSGTIRFAPRERLTFLP